MRTRMAGMLAGLSRRGGRRNPHTSARLILGVLLLANVVAALFAFKPWASSVEDLERQAAGLRSQIRAKEQSIERLKRIVAKVETARDDGDKFLAEHIMSMRTVSSTLVSELAETAQKAGVKQKETRFAFEPVEGSEDLTRATINAYYDGTYADLMHFLNQLDRSRRFLIVESLSAQPQQNNLTLNINLKLNAFVRDDGSAPPPATADQEPAAQQAAANGAERASR